MLQKAALLYLILLFLLDLDSFKHMRMFIYFIYLFIFLYITVAPVGLMEALDDQPPSINSVGLIC